MVFDETVLWLSDDHKAYIEVQVDAWEDSVELGFTLCTPNGYQLTLHSMPRPQFLELLSFFNSFRDRYLQDAS